MGTQRYWNKGTRGEYRHVENAYNAATAAELSELRRRLEAGEDHVTALAETLFAPGHPLRTAAPKVVENWYSSDDVCMWPVNAELSGLEVKKVIAAAALAALDAIGTGEPGQRGKVEFWTRCGTPHLQAAVEPGDPTRVWISTPYNSGYGKGGDERLFAALVAAAEAAVDAGVDGPELNDHLARVADASLSLLPVFSGKLRRNAGPSDRDVETVARLPGDPFPIGIVGPLEGDGYGGDDDYGSGEDHPHGPEKAHTLFTVTPTTVAG